MESMKLLLVVVNGRDVRNLRDSLLEAGFRFTEIATTSGLLREGNATLLIGVAASEVDKVLELVGEHCRGRDRMVSLAPTDTRLYSDTGGQALSVRVGGAQVFVLHVEQVVHV
jgi:uncharacterized protein YaaQ